MDGIGRRVALSDVLALDWRTQFDVDFLVHLFLLATWIIWREGGGLKAYVYGFLSIVMGGMFSFPYLLLATYRAQGKPQALLWTYSESWTPSRFK